jgi:hypothetical protein
MVCRRCFHQYAEKLGWTDWGEKYEERCCTWWIDSN